MKTQIHPRWLPRQGKIIFPALAVFVLLLAGILLLRFYLDSREQENFTLIEPGLYMGGKLPKAPPGTDAVLNLCESDDGYRAGDYFWSPIPDTSPAPSLEWLEEKVNYVTDQRSQGKTVYVHCRAGVSRAGLVVVAYEMAKNHWTRDQALDFVRSQRPVTRPNPALMELLLEWEAKLGSEKKPD
jgi:hypothetical protein